MSANAHPTEVHSEDRTPAPAGSMSRILAEAEALKIGLAPWAIQEIGGEPQLAGKTAGTRFQEQSAATSADLELSHKREIDEAVNRTRAECESRAQTRVQQEIEPWLKRMAQSIDDMATIKQRYLAESEEQLVRLAVAIARRILYREIQVDGEALMGLIHAATQQSQMRELNRILLNPSDLEALRPHLDRLRLPPRVEVVADSGLERGALMLESTSGILDASIQAQLDEVERGFVDLLGKRQ